MCCSLVCVSLCYENRGWRSSFGNLLGKAVASRLCLTYAYKVKSKISCYVSSSLMTLYLIILGCSSLTNAV